MLKILVVWKPCHEFDTQQLSQRQVAHLSCLKVYLVELLNNSFSVFKQYYTFPHTFSPTRILKNYKQHYSNFSTKRALMHHNKLYSWNYKRIDKGKREHNWLWIKGWLKSFKILHWRFCILGSDEYSCCLHWLYLGSKEKKVKQKIKPFFFVSLFLSKRKEMKKQNTLVNSTFSGYNSLLFHIGLNSKKMVE